jgi:two-component system alkaline phosphatase synthesis response regulator PhoP
MNKRIVLIEDDLFLNKIFKKRFEEAGFEVHEMSEGVEVPQKIIELKPELVILDLILPGQTGFQILKQLKDSPNTKDIPVVIASNLKQQSDIDKVMELGAADYVVKSDVPFEEFLSVVQKYMPKE